VYNDKGNSRIFAFDYNLVANRLVVGGSTRDKEIRKYEEDYDTPLIIQYSTAALTFQWGFTLKGLRSYKIDAIKYNKEANLIFSHLSRSSE
jgi:hypothetical protein